MASFSFDGLAGLYDETRDCDPGCFGSALDYLEGLFPPQTFGRLIEPGVGTGRIAFPLARRGYRVTGVDISEDMLSLLSGRLRQAGRPARVDYLKADVTQLPFHDGAFDVALAVHLFYFVRDWEKAAREILRVTRAGGPVVLMHTGTGAEIPRLNERYRELCAGLGHFFREVGARSTREVVDYFERLGCEADWVRDRWRWAARVRLDRALGHLRARAYSFTASVPDAVHAEVLRRLESLLRAEYGDLSAEVEVPNEVYLVIIRRA